MNDQLKKTLKGVIPSFIISFAKVIISFTKEKKSNSLIKEILKKENYINLEIGAGDQRGENGWITLDLTRNCDIYWDLRKGIPFPDESIHKIYSSHLFEHLSFKEIQKLLDECSRVLVPGGYFSICVPNARIYIEAYLQKERLDKSIFFNYKSAYNNTTKIDYVNYTAYMNGEHKYMFDEENLVAILEKKGFKNVHSRSYNPNLDKRERDFESIYAEAQK
ncbi:MULTISPECIES: class I SAM-dependent methyltransferase [unclassified Coleofasciculus]|uniref:class I SAM-dependent methyltransferase n=1 Tax=unclassified Coleofasciculus TaxID=2692782 RepID=UPI0018811726|nr:MULTISPECIES: methyltransferase domain-containing protein [unclassified Coleofasciculus]MBE9125847.1 methyltransferase domain-containing protein [Coleofasciculus sp. LEGE 07081]MBE9149166.1 methyltransferase domain-containing protein [Coleofasciculus sp. LEGE 07092]